MRLLALGGEALYYAIGFLSEELAASRFSLKIPAGKTMAFVGRQYTMPYSPTAYSETTPGGLAQSISCSGGVNFLILEGIPQGIGPKVP